MVKTSLVQNSPQVLDEIAMSHGFRVQRFPSGGIRLIHLHSDNAKHLRNESEALLVLDGFALGYRIGGHDAWEAAKDSISPDWIP